MENEAKIGKVNKKMIFNSSIETTPQKRERNMQLKTSVKRNRKNSKEVEMLQSAISYTSGLNVTTVKKTNEMSMGNIMK